MRKITLTILAFLTSLKSVAQSGAVLGKAGELVESEVKGIWPVIILLIVVGGGSVAAIMYGTGQNRDYPKLFTTILISLAVVIAISGGYVFIKSYATL